MLNVHILTGVNYTNFNHTRVDAFFIRAIAIRHGICYFPYGFKHYLAVANLSNNYGYIYGMTKSPLQPQAMAQFSCIIGVCYTKSFLSTRSINVMPGN